MKKSIINVFNIIELIVQLNTNKSVNWNQKKVPPKKFFLVFIQQSQKVVA